MKRVFQTCLPRFIRGQVRNLNIHEYSSKELLKASNCSVERGIACESVEQVAQACANIPSTKKVVKAQILAGGRGKGTFTSGLQGGVHVCADTEKATSIAGQMLGQTLVTKQTGPKGKIVNKVYVAEFLPEIKKEYYLALMLDARSKGPLFIASAEGGMDIEAVAAKTPEKVLKMPINIFDGLTDEKCDEIVRFLGMNSSARKEIQNIYRFAKEKDATLVEINPFVELEDGRYICADAKVSFDDNAEFRHPDVWKHNDASQRDAREVKAAQADLNYIGLDGNIGCLVNGAGLAMATMDVISMYGGKPANFLDVGGSATADQVSCALSIIQEDPSVKSILINIFGGIMKCDTIAKGVVDACKKVDIRVPLVVRLCGTNSLEGSKILNESGLKIQSANDLNEAAEMAVKLA